MWRTVKLTFNLLITAVVFNYFISVLVLLLNPQILFTSKDFLLLYLNLLIFYGPLWFIFLGCAFVVIQFFSEKKYSIGVFGPPTVTYFLAFSILIITFILYLNYDYYFDFFPPEIRINLIKILLINLALIITGVVFVFFKRINKKWIQILFLVLLSYNILYSYTAIIHTNRSGAILSGNKKEEPAPRENVPRKIRVVVMDGLSLDIIYALSSEQKVLNFKEITKKGAGGRVTCYKPNLSLSLINSALTGLKPSEFTPHSNIKYKFLLIDEEFDIRPRYIFFRKSSFLKIASFYNKNDNFFLDNIARYYEANGLRTIRLIRPELPPVYGEKSLRKNSRFVQLFSDLLNKKDEKFDILKKAFFFDDYLMNCMRSHWRDNSIYYSIVRFPGLGIVGKYF
ncbi:MAG: hypothetical protein GY757_13140, partial [bacterium]|nr:hypothetical protein [bacterium]